MVQPKRTALDEPRQERQDAAGRPTAPTRGWSLDFTGSRRASVVLSLALLMTALGTSGVYAAGYDPASDVNSMSSTTDYTGAQAWWAAGYTGKGVDVALIDSGVSPVEGLDAPGKVINGPDLSLESQAPNLTNLDTFGHGTFMAGLIAGRDAAYRGMAPDARIVSVKVATADGGTDVSQVIAAIDWVVQHRNDNGMNIRVLNLSYGTNSSQWYGVDPLAFAVEQAWDAGIVVVAAAGNSGYQGKGSSPALANPAFDKRIIAVGASDSMGTATLTDDTVPDFSAAARTGSARAPDFVAPGRPSSRAFGCRTPTSTLTSPTRRCWTRGSCAAAGRPSPPRSPRGLSPSSSTSSPTRRPIRSSVCSRAARTTCPPAPRARAGPVSFASSPSSRPRSRSTSRPSHRRWAAGRSKGPADRIT